MILLINTVRVHRSIKMKPIGVASDSYAECNEDSNTKKSKFKVAILGFQNTKIFFLKETLQIGQEKFLFLVKVKV